MALPLLLLAVIVSAVCAGRPTPMVRDGNGDDTERHSAWLDMFARGYFPGRSGQLFFVPAEGDFVVDEDPLYRFMHGSPWSYDSELPLLFHGRTFVRSGSYSAAARQQDIAPTLAAAMQIAPPATATGAVLKDALRPNQGRPAVVALFVLDGMRRDYFDTHAREMPTLRRLRAEGAWFANARADTIPTATSVGHATIGTGADPRVHGLVANELFNRATGKPQLAYNGLDPSELMALTLADVWNVTTNGRAIVIGQGGAIRATAGLVGHGACMINGRKVLAASYATRDAGWETNERCYTRPDALESINGASYWKEAGGTWMGHPIATPQTFRPSALFQRFEGDALAAVLESQSLGRDDITDLVFVNMKAPDYVSHAYGPASAEMTHTLAELDRQIARALDILRRKAGDDRLLVAVTADHGMPGEPGPQRRRILLSDVIGAIDTQFSRRGTSVIDFFDDPANAQIYMNEARLREVGVSLDDVARFLRERFFQAVFTEDQVRRAQGALPLGR